MSRNEILIQSHSEGKAKILGGNSTGRKYLGQLTKPKVFGELTV